MPMETFIQVVTTVEKQEDAQRIARAMVEKRLAACAQVVGPITSTYWWKGRIEEAQEWQCLLKTREDRFDVLEQAIRGIHPYEVPEIVSMPLVQVSPAYREWLRQELT
ncbi:MAG TPA: divalent-cation tolerance protein CutA [Syntrophales bacterium]|jgi:periplasmic divalent cation tolerance protein|nr:divalent-cation tolerance protein CutA [Syntrophales bacterium]